MIIESINNDIAKLMKENDKANLTTLKMAKNAIQTEKINKNKDLTNDDVIAVLRKFIKQKKDDIEEVITLADNKMYKDKKMMKEKALIDGKQFHSRIVDEK